MEKKLTLEDIDRFLADRAGQRAIEASRDSRSLQICYPTEVPLSRFLAWLFDPTKGHYLNGAALRAADGVMGKWSVPGLEPTDARSHCSDGTGAIGHG